jgi:hypothetical protein
MALRYLQVVYLVGLCADRLACRNCAEAKASGDSGVGPEPSDSANSVNSANVRVINLVLPSPYNTTYQNEFGTKPVPPADQIKFVVTLDGTAVPVNYAEPTAYASYAAGNVSLSVYEQGNQQQVLKSSVEVKPGQSYSLTLVGYMDLHLNVQGQGQLFSLLLQDSAQPPSAGSHRWWSHLCALLYISLVILHTKPAGGMKMTPPPVARQAAAGFVWCTRRLPRGPCLSR